MMTIKSKITMKAMGKRATIAMCGTSSKAVLTVLVQLA
jgi:hypothetical protein